MRARLLPQEIAGDIADSIREDPFRLAFLRLKLEQRLYNEQQNGVTFLTPALFRAAIPIPDNAPTGSYEVDVKLFVDGVLLARTQTALEVVKTGFEQFVANAARDHGLFYGLATALMALLTGWFASVVFRKDLSQGTNAMPRAASILEVGTLSAHVTLAPENFTTLPHFSVSSATSLPKSLAEPGSIEAPSSRKRAFVFGSARIALTSRLSFSMISAGVPFGAPRPYHEVAS